MTPFDRRTRAALTIALVVALLALGVGAGWEAARAQSHMHMHGAAMDKGGWLVRLAPDARTAAIERQFRGLETTMAEVSYRYTELYWGAIDGNWGYAEHMAGRLGDAFNAGLERRPQFRKNADALFLKTAYPQLLEAIRAKDLTAFKQRIETLRAACTACHAAEQHPFIKIGVPTVRLNPIAND